MLPEKRVSHTPPEASLHSLFAFMLTPSELRFHRPFLNPTPKASMEKRSAVDLAIRRISKMALSYGDVSRFVRDNGDVKAFAERSQVTLLRNGSIDSVAFIEKDAVRFEYEGKSY